MLPETSEQDALMIFRRLHEVVHAQPVETERYVINFTATTGLVENNGGTLNPKETMGIVAEALQTALSSGSNGIEFVRTKPSPFIVDETELEHSYYDLTTASGGATPFTSNASSDPNKTQPLPSYSAIAGRGNMGSGWDEFEIDLEDDTPTPTPLGPPVKMPEPDATSNGTDVVSGTEMREDNQRKTSSNEKVLKEKLLKRIRERQQKQKAVSSPQPEID
jgi:hypothetical protein